jgi:putative membrane protein insertion efficiency factor
VSPAAALLAGCVRGYQLTLRPVIGANCRFEPSCSHYAIAAFATHGAWRGSALAARRILRCNPWHAGGDDPVPRAPLPTQGRTAP